MKANHTGCVNRIVPAYSSKGGTILLTGKEHNMYTSMFSKKKFSDSGLKFSIYSTTKYKTFLKKELFNIFHNGRVLRQNVAQLQLSLPIISAPF